MRFFPFLPSSLPFSILALSLHVNSRPSRAKWTSAHNLFSVAARRRAAVLNGLRSPNDGHHGGEEGLKGKGVVRFRVWHWHDAKREPTREGPQSGPGGAQRDASTSGEPSIDV